MIRQTSTFDGLAEELLNSLTRIDRLEVAARTTSFQYKDRTGDVSEIARQLRVAHILEGSVRRSGSRVRVTAQLIKASDGYHLWSESYDRELEDIFEVNRTSRAESRRSCVSSWSHDRRRAIPRHSICCCGPSPDAAAERAALLESRKLLEQALDHDPKYAAAWSHWPSC